MIKIISGGQTGVDRAALEAARLCQLSTGGWLPKHCLCQDGNRPDLLAMYGMKEHPNVGYPPRTKQNVFDSDATLRFATDWKSTGEKLTLSAIKKFNKPYFDIKSSSDVVSAIEWIRSNKFSVVNCAGNSENTSPGIYGMALNIFLSIFSKFGTCPGCNGLGKIYGDRSYGLSDSCYICYEKV